MLLKGRKSFPGVWQHNFFDFLMLLESHTSKLVLFRCVVVLLNPPEKPIKSAFGQTINTNLNPKNKPNPNPIKEKMINENLKTEGR
jgi:hypothetical protein